MAVAGIVLAAGASARMGENKLLLRVGGESLLRRAVRAAREGGLDPVLVVVGHEAEAARAELRGERCEVVVNPRHALGMSTSLDAGVAAVPVEAVAAVVLLADMPFVGAAAVKAVVAAAAASRAPLASARYGAVPAPPVYYARRLFAELRGGTGEGRGREVVRRHAGEVAFAPLPEADLLDLDAPADLARARARAQVAAGPEGAP